MREENVIIIGAGLAGISAAIEMAETGQACILVSAQASERAQSVLAEGGINAALDTKGEGDSIGQHFEDTMKGGCQLADSNAVYGLVENAPGIVRWLWKLGVPFTMNGDEIDLRSFGGQKKKRTAYAKSSTGKMLMTALIDEVRKYETKQLVKRLPHHRFVELLTGEKGCVGCRVVDSYTDQVQELYGPVILAVGGLHGFFGDATTGTIPNDGNVAATVFRQGVRFGNLEMIQYHPTTIQIPGKRLLVSEAARGEGGRLYIRKDGKPWYFMEERYPEFGNLAPRDVVAREMVKVAKMPECESQVYLDMTELSEETWNGKLSDLRNEIVHYLNLDPAKEAIPVEPGIHYFMGGILTDEKHRTNLFGLYAAGECACQYHGANRLGGNSMLGAIYGGKVAAKSALEELGKWKENLSLNHGKDRFGVQAELDGRREEEGEKKSSSRINRFKKSEKKVQAELLRALGIIREEASIQAAIDELEQIQAAMNPTEDRIRFALAMLFSARERKESRGAHYRVDALEQKEEFRKTTVAEYRDGKIGISFQELPEFRGERGVSYGKEN